MDYAGGLTSVKDVQITRGTRLAVQDSQNHKDRSDRCANKLVTIQLQKAQGKPRLTYCKNRDRAVFGATSP